MSAYHRKLCHRCGYPLSRVYHREGCRVTDAMLEALRGFKAENGTRWKSKLCDAWAGGDDLGTELQQVRNVVGPARLYKLEL